jgi:hypothetical protein
MTSWGVGIIGEGWWPLHSDRQWSPTDPDMFRQRTQNVGSSSSSSSSAPSSGCSRFSIRILADSSCGSLLLLRPSEDID